MLNKIERLRKRLTLNVVLVANRTIQRRDVGKGQVRTLNLNAPGQRIRRTMTPTPKPQNRTIDQHHPTTNPHQTKMSQKTNFATTPIYPTSLCPTIYQIGPSNSKLSQLPTTIDGLSFCCLAATDGQSYHHYI